MNGKNFIEFFHDAVQYRDELFTLFDLGYLELKERAKAEALFSEASMKALSFYKLSGLTLEEFDELEKSRIHKYMANFSIFQSIPDTISVDQLFPVMPITRLNENPQKSAIIVDLTCDSDGCLENFVDKRDVKHSLALHALLPNEVYHIGFFLVGAYQEALGNNHNLFGAVNEIVVYVDERGEISRLDSVRGEDVGEILRIMNYDAKDLESKLHIQIDRAQAKELVSPNEAYAMRRKVSEFFLEYPYLVKKNSLEIIG